MSRREHIVLRLGALALLAMAAWFPRGAADAKHVRANLSSAADAAQATTTLTSASYEVASLGR